MFRRECMTAIGSTVGVGAAAIPGVGRAAGVSLERTCPADSVTYVRPGGTLVFEAAASPGVETHRPEWDVSPYRDGEAELSPADPFLTYTGITGNPATFGEFVDPGWYLVTVSVGATQAYWWVYATEEAPAAPAVDLTCDPGAGATVTPDEDVVLTATASDRDDRNDLDRIVWQEGRNATYVDTSDVSGADAAATWETSGRAAWVVGGYPAAAWAVCRDGRVASARTDPPDVRALRSVSITGTNAPVDAGEELVVEAELAADGDSMYHGFVDVTADLVVGHDPTHVDSVSREIYVGETATVELSFTTATVANTQTFPVRVETSTSAARSDVTVIGTDDDGGHGRLEVTGLETNTPVTGGEPLEATATLANRGDEPADREVELVVGHDPEVVDTQSVNVGAGETTTVSLGYETYPVKTDDEFPVTVGTGDDTATRTVLVRGTGDGDHGDGSDGDAGTATFAASITGTNAPVDGGEWLSVSARIENTGDGAGTHDVELVVGHDPTVVDTTTVALEPGEASGLSLGYETHPVSSDDTFPVTVRTPHSSDTRTVTVRGVE